MAAATGTASVCVRPARSDGRAPARTSAPSSAPTIPARPWDRSTDPVRSSVRLPETDDMTEPVRIGVVGAGALAHRFGIPDVYTDIEDLFEGSDLDAVVIATPNHLHEPHVLAAVAAGIDVLCERPMALTSRGAERIVNAAARAGRKVLAANNYRFRSDVQALAGFLRGGELGKLTGVRAGAYHHKRSEQGGGWRNRRAESGGGAFF